jgi:hypothetical protein
MKAEIFHAPGQEDAELRIRNLVSSRIFPSIEVVAHPLSGGPGDFETQNRMRELAERYIRLLQASIPPATRLQLGLSGDSAYGFYTYSDYHYHTSVFQDGFGRLLPALAIQDRMMLVPLGLSTQLTGTYVRLSIFRPLEMGGVMEVDFNDDAQLEGAVSKVGEKLRTEMIQEFRAYASYGRRKEIDFVELAQKLGVDWRFLEDSLRERAQEMTFYSQLSCRLSLESLAAKTWTQVCLTVVNDSDIGLTRLAIEVAGPVQILPHRLEVDVPAHASKDLKVALRAREVGEFPLEIVFFLPGDQIFRDWMPDHHVWLNVHS